MTRERGVPNEIPTKENPDHSQPVRDPNTPNESNPINPKTDEPIRSNN